ncbi:hypothetical protein SAMN05192589_11532 [Paracidovorax valerianellae]|uniref:Uncharacterized protein n=1 Tax=Paracidovorax valerianellae TaxID=187868 RepID=A0A1G7BY19_9BURK|nr:hypothetical protein SAMN05192589_11532 [Paracidovorax valerianellae]
MHLQSHASTRIATPRKALTAAWAVLLVVWVVIAWNAQSGFSSSGPMNMRFAPALLVFFSLPVSLFAPWSARVLGTWLHRAAALAVVAITCWWQFWLPATMADISYSLRYDIPDPYIWPGEPGAPVLALSVALWLMTPLADWKGRGIWACWALGMLCTIAAVKLLGWSSHDATPWQAALCCLVGLAAVMTACQRTAPERRIFRWLMLWAAGMMGLVVFWYATEAVAGWVPLAMNQWFVNWRF